MTEFLGAPDIGLWQALALFAAAIVTTFIGTVTGTAGGLLLLAFMTFFLPLVVLIPVHTVVQLGAGTGRTFLMWRYVRKELLVPFAIGAGLGALVGANAFVSLTAGTLQAILGIFIFVVM